MARTECSREPRHTLPSRPFVSTLGLIAILTSAARAVLRERLDYCVGDSTARSLALAADFRQKQCDMLVLCTGDASTDLGPYRIAGSIGIQAQSTALEYQHAGADEQVAFFSTLPSKKPHLKADKGCKREHTRARPDGPDRISARPDSIVADLQEKSAPPSRSTGGTC